MAEKSSFVLYDKYEEQIKMLSDQQAGQLFKAIYACRLGQEMTIEDPAVAILWSVIRQQMAVDEQRYQEVCDKRRAAGQKGGRPAKMAAEIRPSGRPPQTEGEQMLSASEANAFFASVPDPDGEDESDGDIDKNNFPPQAPQEQTDWHERFSPAMGEKLDEWLAYKAEKRQKYKPQGLKTLFSKALKEIDEYGEQAVMEVIDRSMSSGYQGIVWDQLAASVLRNKNTTPPKRLKSAENLAGGDRDESLEDLLSRIQAWEKGDEA